jgi:hypothetical protein
MDNGDVLAYSGLVSGEISGDGSTDGKKEPTKIASST